jgi:hypothetical protein
MAMPTIPTPEPSTPSWSGTSGIHPNQLRIGPLERGTPIWAWMADRINQEFKKGTQKKPGKILPETIRDAICLKNRY